MKKLILLLCVLSGGLLAQPISGLPTTTTGSTSDYLVKGEASGGLGSSRKITVANFISTYFPNTGVTSIATGYGLTGGTITSTGTLKADTTGRGITTHFQLNNTDSVGTITRGVWSGTAIGTTKGGTGLTSYTTGDIIYADGTNTLSTLPDVSLNSFLRSGGVGVAPFWSTLKLPNSATQNYVTYATAANTLGSSAGLVFDGTNLGINNTAPVGYIDIKQTNGIHEFCARAGDKNNYSVIIGNNHHASTAECAFIVTNDTMCALGGVRPSVVLVESKLGNYPSLSPTRSFAGIALGATDTISAGDHGATSSWVSYGNNYSGASGVSSYFASKTKLEFIGSDGVIYLTSGGRPVTTPALVFRSDYGGENNFGRFQNTGEFAFGSHTPATGTRVSVKGTGSTSSTFTAEFHNSTGTNNALMVRDDGKIGIGTSSPAASSIVDITSTTGAFLPPRMNTTQMNAISSPANGSVIYNTDSVALMWYNSAAWKPVGSFTRTSVTNSILLGTNGGYPKWSSMTYPLTSTANYIPYSTATNTLSAGSANLVFDGSNLGIGGITPIVAVDAQTSFAGFGSSLATIGRYTAYTNNGAMSNGFGPRTLLAIKDNVTGPNNIAYFGAVMDNASKTTGSLVFGVVNAGSFSESMRCQYDGKNGFGTTAPSARLHTMSTTEQLRVGYDASNYYSTTAGSTGGITFDAVGSGAAFTFSDKVSLSNPIKLKNYTVATLPTGVQGDMAFVTDATAPTYLGTAVGGGAVVAPVFYDGTNWVTH